jgi:chitinase
MKPLYCVSEDGGYPNFSSLSFLLIASVLSLLFTSVQAQDTASYDPYSLAARCPFPCGDDRNDWAQYHDIHQLDSCNRTVLLDLNLYNKVDDPKPHVSIRSCAAQGSSPASVLKRRQIFSFASNSNSTNSSITAFNIQNQTTNIQNLWQTGGSAGGAAVSAVALALADHIRTEKIKGPTILFAKTGNAILGVYAGRQIEKKSVSEIILDFAKRAANNNVRQAAAQICDSNRLSTQILGIFADTTGNLAAVQDALRGWNDAECISDSWDEEEIWQDASMATIPGDEITVGPDTGDDEKSLTKRATCSYTQAVAGDGCWALADRCKIPQETLIEYNRNPNLCNNLVVGQYVCCSAGDLPDFTPQPNQDGTCKTYTIQSGDVCDTIARRNSMTVDQINQRNKKTWGWTGCSYLIVGGSICLSTGSPPMPAPVSNAVCGPQVPGTRRPADMSTLADLNSCPLKACCNVWGQCGTTQDFCIPSPADTGAPGTATPGSNGCIASCGMDIVNNASPPASFMRVGYFEAWNLDRPCLHMLV